MTDSEKADSSTGKAKGKLSLLDDDISKDFMSSWKSMSMTGGDDMDFNFEPVTKGNKKSFDFGKLDMDFSLDGFGKMSSFKVDMPELDFSTSPKKSTKSKDTSEVEPKKGGHSKNNDFTFSFDFDGMDDFSLDVPSTKGGKSASNDKNKKVSTSKDIECEESIHAANDSGKAAEDTRSKTPPISDNEANSSSENLMDGKGNHDASFNNYSFNSAIEETMFKPEEKCAPLEEKLSGDVQENDQHNHLADETSFDYSCAQGAVNDFNSIHESSPSKSGSLSAPFEVIDTKKTSNSEKMSTAKGTGEEVQAEKTISNQLSGELKMKELSTKPSIVMSSQYTTSEETELCSHGRIQNDRFNDCSLTGEPSAAATTSNPEKLKPDKLSPQLTDKMKNENEENKNVVVGGLSRGNLTSDIMDPDPSATNSSETLPCESRSNAKTQRSSSKVLSTPFGRGSTLAKPMLMAYKVPGPHNLNFSKVENMKHNDRGNICVLERKNRSSTHLSAEDGNKDNGKVDSNPNSCSKEVVNQNSASKITDKNADGDTLSRECDNNQQTIESEKGVDLGPHDGRAMKDANIALGSELKIKDVKYSSSDISISAPPQQEIKLNKHLNTRFKDKMPSMVQTQKSNISEISKLPSLTIGKKLSGPPRSKISMKATTNKHSDSPPGENSKSVRTSENRFPTKIKAGLTIDSEKQRPSPSPKRKLSEAADEGPINLHPQKRPSPGESRMSKGLSSEKAMDEGYKKDTPSEGKKIGDDPFTSTFEFHHIANMEDLSVTSVLDSDANVEKAEACAKELEDICNMLRKKHEEAKELLVRSLVNNNYLLMLDHPIYEEKIRAVQKFADRLMSKDLKAEA